ncbi:MAG: hypothetical protein RKP73_05945 [Candidatus Contendobacter sp.]|nr:hypothetical protein [Candidatus Contendobacter sp.]
MNDLDLIKMAGEVERYPALLAWLQYLHTSGVAPDLAYPACRLDENPWEDVAGTSDLFDRYVERGETGAAQYLARKYPELLGDKILDKVLRRKSQLVQQLAEARLNARDVLVQIKEANSDTGRRFAGRLEAIEEDVVLTSFRLGLALERFQGITQEMLEAVEEERGRVLREAKGLLNSVRDNSDVETAVKRIEEIASLPEGLATAAHLLGIAKRAEAGTMSQDDIRLLYSASRDNVRLVRPWSEIRTIVVDASSPAALAECLGRESLTRELHVPAEFDRDRLRDLLASLCEYAGSINTNTVADRLGVFLGLSFKRVEDHRGRYGSSFPFTINTARHKDLSGNDRQMYLSVPLRGTDPSAFSQLYKMLADADGRKALPILLYPGIADPGRALSQLLGINEPELLFLDCIDLLRIAEVPIAQRVVALQQVLLPRMPSLGKRTYQTGGPVASELFRGRQDIIDELTSPRGKTVLFSGRMMGKSSVLSRIRDRIMASPQEKHHCVLLSAATGVLLEPLIDKLTAFVLPREKNEIQRTRERLAPSLQDTPKQQRDKERAKVQLLRKVIEIICADNRLTILIDEADTFAKNDSAKDRELSLAWLLRDLENHAPDKLRVVFAGFQTLHHEVIAANGAFANWFGQCQLGPLEREEAISLIKEPLADFGIQFISDAGVERILEFSGRYPLLIQEVCARLMERAMARRSQPIKPGDELMTLRAGEVEMVCREETLRTRLHQVLSLNLDQYPRLKLVTYLTLQAGLYRPAGSEANQADLFRIEDVQSMLVDWYGDKLSEYFSEISLPGLIEELESLGLIARYGDDYRFLNRTFAGMLRDNPNFESELLSLLEQVANPRENESRRYWSLPKEHLDTLLRSRNHILLVGLPGTLKSEVVRALFAREETGSSVLLSDPSIDDAGAVHAQLQRQLREGRKTLSLGDLCVKEGIETLVLDCPKLPATEIVAIAQDISGRAHIRLVATADVPVARKFVSNPPPNFQMVALRRLRPQDIQAWGEKPYKRQDGWEFSLVIDQKTTASLVRATCGYFPLLQQFREHCERSMTRASEYYPSEQHVEAFRKSLTPQKLHRVLLSSLETVELDTLRLLLEEAISLEPAQPKLDRAWAQDLILEKVQDEVELNASLNAMDLLVLLDLITEQEGILVFDNHALLKVALGF